MRGEQVLPGPDIRASNRWVRRRRVSEHTQDTQTLYEAEVLFPDSISIVVMILICRVRIPSRVTTASHMPFIAFQTRRAALRAQSV